MTSQQHIGPLWRLPTVAAHVGLCRSEIYKRMSKGTFPKPVQLGARAVAWRALDIDEWMKSLIQKG